MVIDLLNCPLIVLRLSKKAHSALLLMRGSCVTLTPDIFMLLYTTIVRHHLEYAIQASSPYPKKDIDHLERLQRVTT